MMQGRNSCAHLDHVRLYLRRGSARCNEVPRSNLRKAQVLGGVSCQVHDCDSLPQQRKIMSVLVSLQLGLVWTFLSGEH